MIRKEAVIALLGSPIAYYTIFAKELGGIEAGVFTSQFFYWYGRGQDPTGWIYKTQADIEAEQAALAQLYEHWEEANELN